MALFVVTVAVTMLGDVAQAQPPAISHALPGALAPGKPTDIVFFGGNLAGPTGIWWNMPAEAALTPGLEKNGTEPGQISYRVNVPATVPVGIYGMRLATGGGISSLRLVMVDDLPSITKIGTNKTLAAAQEIATSVAVDGACEPESYDFYKFNGVAGQRITVEVVARRLGYPLDPVIRLLDATGKELAYSDDAPGIGADCRFAYTLPTVGTYYLELRDIRYQGGGTHRYRLRMGNFPLATAVFPSGGRRGSGAKLQVAGYTSDEVPPMNVPIPGDGAAERMPLSAKFPTGQGSTMVSLATDGLTEQIELEPNDTPETASPIGIPSAVNGRFDNAKDRDYYQFEAKQGQRFLFAGKTRSLGSPSDLYLRVLKADGGQVAEAEDTGGDEGVLDFTAPADGVYRLLVEDLLRRGGPEYVYRVAIEPYQAGFTLAVEADKFDAPKGGVFVAKVTCARRDYEGPISLALEGAGDGLVVAGNTIGEKGKETVLHVTLPPTFDQGRWVNFRVVGTAKIGETNVKAVASTIAPLKGAFNGWAYPPANLDGLIGLGVGAAFADFFQLAPPAGVVVPFPQIVGATSFKVQVTRSNNFDDKVDLGVEGLPPGVTAKVAPIEKGKPDATIELSGPAGLAEGDYPFRVVGTATFQNQPKRVTVDNLVLHVVKPIQVSVAPAGPLPAGGKQAVKLTLTRYGDANGPVTLRFRPLPAGITMPPEITVPEGQSEATLELVATAEVVAGKAELALVASAKVKDRAITIESDPVNLEITRP
ncbi:MAG TPA: PPC domain-containing protein [Pirellulales bacterium]